MEQHETEQKILVCVMRQSAVPREGKSCGRTPEKVGAGAVEGLNPDRVGSAGSPTRVVKIQMSDSRQKSYVVIDDTLPARERIQMIINGGIEQKAQVEFMRGSAESLAQKILSIPEMSKVLP